MIRANHGGKVGRKAYMRRVGSNMTEVLKLFFYRLGKENLVMIHVNGE